MAFPTAVFPDNHNGFSFCYGQGYVFDRMYNSLLGDETDGEIVHGEKVGHRYIIQSDPVNDMCFLIPY